MFERYYAVNTTRKTSFLIEMTLHMLGLPVYYSTNKDN